MHKTQFNLFKARYDLNFISLSNLLVSGGTNYLSGKFFFFSGVCAGLVKFYFLHNFCSSIFNLVVYMRMIHLYVVNSIKILYKKNGYDLSVS